MLPAPVRDEDMADDGGTAPKTGADDRTIADAVVDAEDFAGGPEDDKPARLAAALGLRFRDLDLLRLALTHRSVLHVWVPPGVLPPAPQRHNERLEFLGDALLGAIAAEYLYVRYPDADEGMLTARRVALVRAETLVRWARQIDLGAYLYLGTGERVSVGARDRMLAGAFEAVVGAIALDQGQRAAKRFLRPFLAREVETSLVGASSANPKGRLQELLQERYRMSPAYRTLATEGPAHARSFTVEVALNNRPLGVGVGGSKREAQQAAAAAALALLAEGAELAEITGGPASAPGAPISAQAARAGEATIPDAPPAVEAGWESGGEEAGPDAVPARAQRLDRARDAGLAIGGTPDAVESPAPPAGASRRARRGGESGAG